MAHRDRIYSSSNANNFNEVQMAALATGAQSQNKLKPTNNVSEEFIADTLTHLRSVLLSSKEGLTPKQILYDYLYLVGHPVPYLEMGYKNIVEFLDAMADICETSTENGRLVYRPKINDRCEHIWRLVNSQRSPTRSRRPCKRKSLSINEEDKAAPKRTKSESRKDDGKENVVNGRKTLLAPATSTTTATASTVNAAAAAAATTTVRFLRSVNASTPEDKNKSVHFDELLASTTQRPHRQRSRTRLPFFHKDDPGKPKFKSPRSRGRSLSSLPVANNNKISSAAAGEVISSSNLKKFPRVGNPQMVTSTPRRSIIDLPVPDDIRKNLLRILQDFPKGVFIHDIPDLYKAKFKRELPTFVSNVKSLTEFLHCLTADVRVATHPCGTVTVKMRQFDLAKPTMQSMTVSTTSNLKSHIAETLLRILARRPRGIFLSRLRFEFFKEVGEMIPFKRMGFVSEREMLASMPEIFNLRPLSSEPGVTEYILSSAVLPDSAC